MSPRAADSSAWQPPELVHLPGLHEPFSAVSHLLGAAAFLLLGLFLLRKGWGNRRRVVSLGIYAGSCVLLLSTSALYHMSQRGTAANEFLLRLDHGAIFILIAGTFTPMQQLLFRGWLRWGPLALVWIVAALGILARIMGLVEIGGGRLLAVYLALGWLGGISSILLARRFGFAFVRPLLWGGVAYTVGALMEFVDWPILIPTLIHPHELFHVAVLIGAYCHWLFTWQFASSQFDRHCRSRLGRAN